MTRVSKKLINFENKSSLKCILPTFLIKFKCIAHFKFEYYYLWFKFLIVTRWEIYIVSYDAKFCMKEHEPELDIFPFLPTLKMFIVKKLYLRSFSLTIKQFPISGYVLGPGVLNATNAIRMYPESA